MIRNAKQIGENKVTYIAIDGEIIRDKKIAGEKLLEAIKRVKINASNVIGQYQNMDLEVSYNFFTNGYDFNLKGSTTHSGELGTSTDGNVTRLDIIYIIIYYNLLYLLYSIILNCILEIKKNSNKIISNY